MNTASASEAQAVVNLTAEQDLALRLAEKLHAAAHDLMLVRPPRSVQQVDAITARLSHEALVCASILIRTPVGRDLEAYRDTIDSAARRSAARAFDAVMGPAPSN